MVREEKGRILNGYIRYIEKKWGRDGVIQCGESIGKDLTNILDDRWYPESQTVEIIHWIKNEKGEHHLQKAGYSTVKQTGVISFIAKMAGVERVLESAKKEARESLNYGSIETSKEGKKATVVLTDYSSCPEVCLTS